MAEECDAWVAAFPIFALTGFRSTQAMADNAVSGSSKGSA